MVGSVFRYQNVTVKKLQGGVGFFLTKAGERGLSEESGDYEKSRFHTQRSSLSRTKNKEGKSRESLRDRFFKSQIVTLMAKYNGSWGNIGGHYMVLALP